MDTPHSHLQPARRHVDARPWLVIVAALVMILSLIVSPADASPKAMTAAVPDVCGQAPSASVRLRDVQTASTHGQAIDCMARYGVIGGHPDGTFRPENQLSRGQMASLLARFIEVAEGRPNPRPGRTPFRDLGESVHRDNVAVIHGLGIAAGRTSTEFAPQSALTRGQMATFLLRTLQQLDVDLGRGRASFRDVPSNSAHAEAISKLAAAGVIQGVSAREFAPNRTLTRQQASSLLLRSAALLHLDGAWAPTAGNDGGRHPGGGNPGGGSGGGNHDGDDHGGGDHGDGGHDDGDHDDGGHDDGGHDDGGHDDGGPGDDVAPIDDRSSRWTDPASWSTGEVPTEADDVTIRGEVVIDGDVTARTIVVPPGSQLTFDPDISGTLTMWGNVVVRGRMEMRPSSHQVEHVVRFLGIDETKMVGGHMTGVLDTDVGLWVTGHGVLHAEGTDKTGWNRTGIDRSWRSGDDVRTAPIAKGDTTTFASFTPGSPVPSVTAGNGDTHYTEVFNLTRNVRIEGGGDNSPEVLEDNGRAHLMFLGCRAPQTLRNVELSYVGPRELDDRDGSRGLFGRYGVHFHWCGNGSRGSLVESVVVRDAGNHAFVPHASHGITLRDTVSFTTYESAYWWDPSDETDDVVMERAAAFNVLAHPHFRGFSLDGFTLGNGTNMTLRDSVVAGSQGRTENSGGFHWPSSSNSGPNVWTFHDNVAHNNRDAGLSSWQNTSAEHLIERFVGFHNGRGIIHGAYKNSYAYRDGHLFDNDVADLVSLASSRDRRPQVWKDMVVEGDIRIGRHRLGSTNSVIFDDLVLGGRIIVEEPADSQRSHYVFAGSNASGDPLQLGDIDIVSQVSDVVLVHPNGQRTELAARR